MTPTKWGKFLWISLHLIALGYPDNPSEQEKKDYHNFFTIFDIRIYNFS